MISAALLLLVQPIADDSPLTTAVRPPRVFEAQKPAAPAKTPQVVAAPVAPATLPLLRTAETAPDGTMERRTKVEGDTVQVVFGERATFLLSDEDGGPRLSNIEPGRLAVAHRLGSVRETFGALPQARVAAALDGSAEMGASFLKVWNNLDRPISYRADALVLRGGQIQRLVASVCALAPGETRVQSWPSAVAAVVLSRFSAPEPDAAARAGCS